jgi:SAM-dependent methyltransferase
LDVLCRLWFSVAAFGLAQSATAPTPDIHFVATPNAVVEAMLNIAHVTSSDIVYDLGSGDGRIVIAAAQKYGARGVGIELDPKLIEVANARARKAGVADKVRFAQADLFKADLSEATVVTLFLSPSINMRLQPVFRRQLKPGTRIVSYRFGVRDWPPDQEIAIGGRAVYLWTMPARD